jgi:HD-GYP domain-containing protein (c-di-GMP phosphodiesterase class II)
MLIVPLDEARPDMILAADVMNPAAPDQVLLKRGFQLDQGVLDRMRSLSVQAIYVNYPELDDLDRHLSPGLSPERQQIFSQIKSTIAQVQKVAKPTVGFTDYYVAIRNFVITLMQQGDHPIYLEQLSSRLGDHEIAHATSVAHLSLLMGISLQTYLRNQRSRLPVEHAVEVTNLGVGGMLHDIGKCKLPPEFGKLSITARLSDEEKKKIWETHPQLGFDMIRGGVESSAAAAVLFHHARFDGQGFPAIPSRGAGGGQKPIAAEGTRIHIFARIIGAADLYDRLTHPSGSGATSRRPAFEVLHKLRTEYASWLDPVITNALTKIVPPFAPGSRVVLNDSTAAIVTALGKDPYRPIVRRLAADNWTLEDTPHDLSDPTLNLVIESCEGIPVDIDALTAVDAEPSVPRV